MMDLKLGLIADYANVSQDGKLNVMGIFSRILAQQFPVTHPILHLVLVFSAGSSEKGTTKKIQLRLVDDDGKALVDINGNFAVPDQPGPVVEMQQVFAFQMLQFPKAGSYAFHILVNEETKQIIPLVIEQQAPTNLSA
jgi:hypothetical protein